jgi:hypothetical protein
VAITEYFSGTETVGTTEWSLTTDTAGAKAQTDDGVYQFFLDLSALTKDEEFDLVVYETVISGGTQRVVFREFFSGVQSDPVWVSPSLVLMHGWDATIVKMLGTDKSIDFSVRRIA